MLFLRGVSRSVGEEIFEEEVAAGLWAKKVVTKAKNTGRIGPTTGAEGPRRGVEAEQASEDPPGTRSLIPVPSSSRGSAGSWDKIAGGVGIRDREPRSAASPCLRWCREHSTSH